MKDLIAKLRDTPEFGIIMEELAKLRPVVPAYEPARTVDDQQQLVERIKFQVGMQRGYDLLYRALTGRHPPGA